MAGNEKPVEMRIIDERAVEDEALSEEVSRLEAAADREIVASTVTLRWGKEQVAVVKRAAAILGVPYQTYLKQVVFRQALADIERAEAVLKGGSGKP
jgi:predicted DNA binding CopG/RHH family protein